MSSPFIMTNADIQLLSSVGQDFTFYLAFLNPISITTTWTDLGMDAQQNWLPPPNVDTFNLLIQPYAPTANLGPNRIAFVGEMLYFDGTRSCQRYDLPAVTYGWSATGSPSQKLYANGSQVGYMWASPGIYTVSLSVTNHEGVSTTGTRQVMVYQDRSTALQGVISLSGLSGSLSNGGWQCQLTTVNSQVSLFPPDLIPVGTYQPVVLLCETSYEVVPGVWQTATVGPHGNFSPGFPYRDPRIFFDGYIQNGTIHQDIDKDTLSFVCMGPQLLLNECNTHTVGYYNTNYQLPNHLFPSSNGQGFLVGYLMTADVIHALLQYHTTIGTYHDIHLWNSSIPCSVYQPGGTNPVYSMTYSTLSVTEGTVAQNLTDLANNEWAQYYCEHDGSICVGPQINYRGSDYWQQPTLEGAVQATFFITYLQNLGYTFPDNLNQISSSIPVLPAQPMPVQFVHPWGNQPNPPQVQTPFGQIDPQIKITQRALNGPPILCTFSDTPVYDQGTTPPGGASGVLFPWVTNNWPQDLAIYPLSFDITENYTGRASLVKLIGTYFGHTSVFSSWYPQNAFTVTGNGSGSLVASTLPAGNWIVDQSHLLPDVTTNQNINLMNNYWWEIARRYYYASNVNYVGSITTTMFTACSLGDIVGITRQQNALGEHWSSKPFYVTDISYNIDLTARTWTTVLGVTEVTSILMGPIIAPPANLPRGFY